ncbi:hypothetical protein TNCV_2639831 [Trichonephila clavipes]|nr:hypothetical protein TNCV_2639831 [Trichonephila clavipes]
MTDICVLTKRSSMELHAGKRYEWVYGTRVSIIHEHLQTLHGKEILSRQMASNWCCMLRKERQIVEDENRSGHPSKSTNENSIDPSDFHLLPTLKLAFSGNDFQNNAEVEQAVRQFLASQGSGIYQSSFFKLITRAVHDVMVGFFSANKALE